ncbi:hypothetical protein Ctha_0877 [Chloroherpeton thalassium ATCC 35110]|uniref:Uncharacterized protein n=1 Tax=Chloroherpeton thalassium (strain ATCC 35110 / GB-78) TaxID=517418 RepID=B3QWY1_CHLT3|nr:hypothetical protein [Chloroherpeton thalassium]ACF13345.1 hypothetical protein Ctha_0877 [Chloroherpeton thalassium ATCC 35110]
MQQFQKNDFENRRFDKIGFWLNPTYSWEYTDVVWILRFAQSRLADESYENCADFGLKLTWQLQKLQLGVEGLIRAMETDLPDHRLVALFSYPILENTNLNFTFGKGFDKNPSVQEGDFLALLGATVSFGDYLQFH